jgi:CRP-like cAMP-binding protein
MQGPLIETLVTKLTHVNSLDDEDLRTLRDLPLKIRRLGAQEVVVAYGTRPTESCLVGEGFAFRSKTTVDGRRQILSLHIPGEVPDLQSLHLHVMDHDLMTLTPCLLGFIAHDDLRRLIGVRPSLALALWRETLIDSAIFREWLLNVASRPAISRMSHLFVEMYKRLEAIGHASGGAFELPITQQQLGECLGLTPVHVNRVLQELRQRGLVRVLRESFHLLDLDQLEQLAGYDATYLHLAPSL